MRRGVTTRVGAPLYAAVRAGFVQGGSSLHAHCVSQRLCRVYARQVLLGDRDGPKAKALRAQLMQAAGVTS